ncbi:MAG TPA: HAMP domain-containing sensor histidine kinase [Thermoanaerobaculia bacterium]
MTAPHSSRLATRWDLWLPLAAAVVAAFLLTLGITAARALRESRDLALEGLVMRQAHEIERELRESGPEAAPEILERSLREGSQAVLGIALVSPLGVDVQAGSLQGPTRDLELFLGRGWRPAGAGFGMGMGQPAFQGGRRTLRIALSPSAARASFVERSVAPAAAGAGVLVFALAVLGGRLLVRQQEEQAREAIRRRLEGLGRAGASLAHQLRNPLATLKGSIQLLLESPAPGSEKRLRSALEQAVRMESLIGQLLDYARPPRAEPAELALGRFLERLADGDARLRVEAGGAPAARVDPEHLRQILENLVENALAASPEGSPVEVAVHGRDQQVEVVVADRGPGPGDDPERLFEPYVTGRANGTGLGLPIARALAEANGGSLLLRPRPGGGTLAVLTLPRGGAA